MALASGDLISISIITMRVLFLVLFLGANIWLISSFYRGALLIPPPQRIILFRSVFKPYLTFSWVFIIIMTAGGLASIYTLPAFSLGHLLSSEQGILLLIEGAVTLLLIVNSIIQFLFFAKLKQSSVEEIQSADKSQKWLMAKKDEKALAWLGNIMTMSAVNTILSMLAVVLGVMLSNIG